MLLRILLRLLCRNVVGVGLQWSNINTVVSVDDNFTMLHTLMMLCVGIIFFAILAWYLDAVLPGDFGTPQPFYFPFTVFVKVLSVVNLICHWCKIAYRFIC